MQKYPPVDIEAGEARNGALVAGHRDVAHGLPGLGAKAGGDQFVVAPHRAVEEDERRAGQPGLERVGHFRAGREEIAILARRPVLDAKPERIAGAVAAAWMRL